MKPEREPEKEVTLQVCPNCMARNPESAHLCSVCFTPLSSFAATDPVMSIAARADTFGKAASAPQKPIVLIGMWMIMGPVAFACMVVGLQVVENVKDHGLSLPTLLALAIIGVGAFISIGLLIKTTKNFGKRPRDQTGGFPMVEDRKNPDEAETELERSEEWKAEEEPQ